MADAWRRTLVFAGGLLVGVAVAAWIFTDPSREEAPVQAVAPDPAPSLAGTQAAQPEPEPEAVIAAAPMGPPAVALQPVSCTFDPMLPRSGSRDGQFALQELKTGAPLTGASAYASVAGEMASEGRARDAEVALIMACRVAGVQAGAASPQLADSLVALADHYADAARASARGGRQHAGADTMVERAKALLAGSVRIYGAAPGEDDDKARRAGEQLQALASGNWREPTTTLGAARDSAAREPGDDDADEDGASASARTSFDCGQARSPSERLICSDPQLAQLDRDLGRLHEQAGRVSADPRGFRRRHEQAWLRRESECRGDKACLLRWYQDRRAQLLGEFSRGAQR